MPARRRAAPGLLAALLLLAACREPVEPLPPGTVDLLAPAHAPAAVAETVAVTPRDPAVLGGFHRGDDADGSWAGEGPVRIALGFTDARPRTIEIEALGYSWPGAPPVAVAASLDGVPIGGFEAGGDAWARHRLAVPGELSVPGRHLLELTPSRAVAPAEVDPGSEDPRRLSIRVRELRVTPAGAATPPPELSDALRVPCGSRAEWPLWVPPGSVLEIDARLRRADEAFLVVERDGEAPRRLAITGGGERERLPLEAEIDGAGDGGAAGSAGGAPAIVIAGCTGLGGRLEIRRLVLESPPPPAPRATRPAGQALLVIGAMGVPAPGDAGSAGRLVAAPCSTSPPRALACLITGRESAAFGYRAEPAVGFVAESAEEAAEWLVEAPPPAVAVLMAPEEPARELAAAVAGRVDSLAVLLTRLPRGPNDLAIPFEIADELAAPGLLGASQVDLLPTLYALAGAPAPPVLSGTDLLPLLDRSLKEGRPAAVRPAAAVWDRRRSRAVRGGHVLSVPFGGEVFPRTIEDRVLTAWLARRRADLAWLGDLPGPAGEPAEAAREAP